MPGNERPLFLLSHIVGRPRSKHIPRLTWLRERHEEMSKLLRDHEGEDYIDPGSGVAAEAGRQYTRGLTAQSSA